MTASASLSGGWTLIARLELSVAADKELDSHFKMTCGTAQVADVSWAFDRELPPQKRGR